jgi:hypothetical protein
MPIPAALLAAAPLIAAGVPLLTGGAQIAVQRRANKKNIEFQREQMRTQREWALADWDRVNAYNHPTQQMQRYKEAGLNPQLIYGNVNNSPSSMVRTTTTEAPKIETAGYQQGISQASQAFNEYFSMQQLINQTKLTDAQILKMKADTDRTVQQYKLTGEQWDALVNKPLMENLRLGNLMYATDQQRLLVEAQRRNMPTKEMAYERFLRETANKTEYGKLLIEQYKLAKMNNTLKESDIDFLSELGDSPLAIKYAFDFLRMINGDFMGAIPRKNKTEKTIKIKR